MVSASDSRKIEELERDSKSSVFLLSQLRLHSPDYVYTQTCSLADFVQL